MESMVEQVRRFNRIVTARVGALNDHYLGRSRPLGEARLLWEIGPSGCDVRLLRARLGLDAGYVSRMLQSLESSGLVEMSTGTADRRTRVAKLTPRGRRERALLDRRSNELAQALVAPLDARQQERLIAAMREIETLLVSASAQLRTVDPEDPDARYCLAEYVAELNRRSTRTFDPTVGATVRPDELRSPAGEFLVAYLDDEPIGCGAVKHQNGQPAEIKRMWISPRARGLGLGRRLLQTLEARASDAGARIAHLETNSDLHEAIALYRSTGWVEVDRFNDEPFADRWMEKTLTARDAPSAGYVVGVSAKPASEA